MAGVRVSSPSVLCRFVSRVQFVTSALRSVPVSSQARMCNPMAGSGSQSSAWTVQATGWGVVRAASRVVVMRRVSSAAQGPARFAVGVVVA